MKVNCGSRPTGWLPHERVKETMQVRYTAMIREPSPGNYVAIAPAAPGCRGEGRSRREALDRLTIAIEDWLQSMEIAIIEVNAPPKVLNLSPNPWLDSAGSFADDPTLDALLTDIYAERDAERSAT